MGPKRYKPEERRAAMGHSVTDEGQVVAEWRLVREAQTRASHPCRGLCVV